MSTKFRDWNVYDCGTNKPEPMRKKREESLVFFHHGMRGGVKFHEPVRFQFEHDTARLKSGKNPSNGEPQMFYPPKSFNK